MPSQRVIGKLLYRQSHKTGDDPDCSGFSSVAAYRVDRDQTSTSTRKRRTGKTRWVQPPTEGPNRDYRRATWQRQAGGRHIVGAPTPPKERYAAPNNKLVKLIPPAAFEPFGDVERKRQGRRSQPTRLRMRRHHSRDQPPKVAQDKDVAARLNSRDPRPAHQKSGFGNKPAAVERGHCSLAGLCLQSCLESLTSPRGYLYPVVVSVRCEHSGACRPNPHESPHFQMTP